MLLDLGARPVGPMAVGPHVADRRQCARLRDAAARGRPRQHAEPLRLSLRHQRECARACASSTRARRSTPTPTPRPAARCSAQPGARAYQIYDQKGIKLLPLPGPQGDLRGGRIRSRSWRRRSASSRRCWCTRSRNSTAPCPDDTDVRSAPAGRQGHQGLGDPEIELGEPHRRAAVPRLSGDRRHHVHVRRRRGQPATRR